MLMLLGRQQVMAQVLGLLPSNLDPGPALVTEGNWNEQEMGAHCLPSNLSSFN